MGGKIHNRRYLIAYRKSLRNEGTAAEAALWNSLKCKQLSGRKFRRQHSIENVIVDFFCPAEQLIIELDGNGHSTASGEQDDWLRDKRLESLGFKVLRYENNQVHKHLESVLQDISQHFKNAK